MNTPWRLIALIGVLAIAWLVIVQGTEKARIQQAGTEVVAECSPHDSRHPCVRESQLGYHVGGLLFMNMEDFL